MALFSGLFIGLFGRLFGLRKGALAAALAIAFYTILVGAGAPVVRAALMAGLSLLGRQVGRRQTGLNGLGFVAAVLVLFEAVVGYSWPPPAGWTVGA